MKTGNILSSILSLLFIEFLDNKIIKAYKATKPSHTKAGNLLLGDKSEIIVAKPIILQMDLLIWFLISLQTTSH